MVDTGIGCGTENSRTVEGVGPPVKRIAWSAIFAGAVVALVVQLLLTILGMGIGLSVVDAQEASVGQAFAWGSAIYWILTALISLFAGGWVAGRLSGLKSKTDASLHGFLTWGVTTLAVLFFLGTAMGTLVGGGLSMVGQGAQMARGSNAGIGQYIPESVKDSASSMARQAEQQVDQSVRQLQSGSSSGMQAQAQESVDRAAGPAAMAAWGAFIALLFGALAAWLGGAAGARSKDDIVVVRRTGPVGPATT